MVWLEEGGAICCDRPEVRSYDCSPCRKLTATALLRWVAELADAHLGQFGLSYEQLLQKQVAFLLTAVEVKIHRMPAMREPVVLSTWHRGADRVRLRREAVLRDKEGAVLATYSSEWVLVDPITHRIKRPSALPELEQVPMGQESVGGVAPLKLPETMTPAGERRVGYADLDYNGHLNNTKYADIISDFLLDGQSEAYFTRLRIDFQGEARQGEVLQVATANQDSLRYVSATHERGKCFAAVCEIG